ncbi:MAG: hypothetical protein ABWY78_08560 [Microvirga sp.]
MNRRFHTGFACAVLLTMAGLVGVNLASAGLSNWSSKSDATWAAWAFRKKRDLIEREGSGRVVIVSGSNGLFGISAAELTRLTAHDTINAATHAGLPFELFDEELLRRLRPGDIALLPLESSLYLRQDQPDSLGVHVAHQVGLGYFHALGVAQKVDYLRLIEPGFVIGQYQESLSEDRARLLFDAVARTGYFRLGIDARGDVDLAEVVPDPRKVAAEAGPGPRTDVAETRANQRAKRPPAGFVRKGAVICRSVRALVARGIRVIGTPDNVYIAAAAAIRARQGVLESARALYEGCGGEWVAPEGEGLQPLDRMYDTPLHLNQAGRRLRTFELARALCEKALACPPGTFGKGD